MKLYKALQLAVNILINSKLRSWLTIIGIVIGVAAIISIVSIGAGFEKDVEKLLGGLGSDMISVTSGFDKANVCPGPNCRSRPGENTQGSSTKPLGQKELQALKSIPEIEYINTIISGSDEVYYIGETAKLSIEGIDTSVWKHITTATLERGRFFGPGDTNAIVIGSSVAHEIFKNPIGLNRALIIHGKSFMVVGILSKSGGFGFDDKKIFMPFNSAKDILKKGDNVYDSFSIKARDQDKVDIAERTIEQKLMVVRHVNKDTKDFTVLSMKTIKERVSAIMTGFTLFLGVIAAVSLLVGAVGIANTMFTSVLEKTKEIGIMKAVGAQNMDIMLIFLFNSGLVGLVGGILGVLFGVGIALVIPTLGVSFVEGGNTLTTSITPSLIIFALIFSMVIGMISGVVPAYRASKLRPVDALRAE